MSRQDYVFIIGGEGPVLLHPFSLGLVQEASSIAVVGRCPTGYRAQGADELRKELYRAAERGLRQRFNDRTFIARVAASTAAFVIVYLFCALVIRDPIPLLDELLFGAVAAAAVYIGMERRALASPRFTDALMDVRRTIDGLFFTESRVVDLFEAWRDDLLVSGPAAFHRPLERALALRPEERAEAESLCELLAARWRRTPLVTELYEASLKGKIPGPLLDKARRRLGDGECALALAYLRLLALVTAVPS